ncbi:glutathione S-transferase [Venturia nashicola]|nr:glutathione S-transferase [Venturia nashicola]
MASQSPNINLYTIQYIVHKIDITKNTQKEPWFLAINPNGRIPALTDTFTDGSQINLFESGSIQQYLVARYDPEYKISFPPGSRESFEINNWLFFLNAGVGPMQGQANHFTRYAPEIIQYGVDRYQNETRRLYGVLDAHLKEGNKEYLVGNKCTIADIAHWGWIAAAGWAGVNIEDFPALKAWEDRMAARPGVEKGKNVPSPYTMKELLADKEKMEKHAAESRKWVQAGMKEDAKKGK